jgi:plasmid stabilization system protein ParE
MKSVRVHPAAEAESVSAFEWYWARSRPAALHFDAELRRAFMIVSHAPQRCAPFLHGTRRVHLSRFPYAVVFRELNDRIEILAVAHVKRRPGYWTARSPQPTP